MRAATVTLTGEPTTRDLIMFMSCASCVPDRARASADTRRPPRTTHTTQTTVRDVTGLAEYFKRMRTYLFDGAFHQGHRDDHV